jgi:hypothetical protein
MAVGMEIKFRMPGNGEFKKSWGIGSGRRESAQRTTVCIA